MKLFGWWKGFDWWKNSIDEGTQLMKKLRLMKKFDWWKNPIDEGARLMKKSVWWKGSVDGGARLMKELDWWRGPVDEGAWLIDEVAVSSRSGDRATATKITWCALSWRHVARETVQYYYRYPAQHPTLRFRYLIEHYGEKASKESPRIVRLVLQQRFHSWRVRQYFLAKIQ